MSRKMLRDVMVNCAVTLSSCVNGIEMVGEKDKEFNQWAFCLRVRHLPCKENQIKRAMEELTVAVTEEFRRRGLIKL